MNKVLVVLLIADLLYVGTGGLLIGMALRTKNEMDRGATLDNVAANLLLMRAPWIGTSRLGPPPYRRTTCILISSYSC